ncbi:MAG: MEDS domain-containing protein [Nitrospira sp.]|nr:MEDS domain-containing protein [Nitrospira sp.]
MPISGLRGTHEIPLGSHLCLFYRYPQEFLRVTASFLKAGLTLHELCLWVLPATVTIPLALQELSRHGVNGSKLVASKQLHISPAQDWYSSVTFNVEDSLSRLANLPSQARKLGYASIRAAGGPGRFSSATHRGAFMRYEQKATPIIADLPFIGLCCYATRDSLETDMYDIMSAHPWALLRTNTGWSSI